MGITCSTRLQPTLWNNKRERGLRYVIGEYEPLLDSLVGGNFNDLAIPPGGLVRMHISLSMVERGTYRRRWHLRWTWANRPAEMKEDSDVTKVRVQAEGYWRDIIRLELCQCGIACAGSYNSLLLFWTCTQRTVGVVQTSVCPIRWFFLQR